MPKNNAISNTAPPPAPAVTGWGERYESMGLQCCQVTGKVPQGKGWSSAGNQITSARAIDQKLAQGGLGCVHGPSGTATLDLDTHLHLALYAARAAGVDLVPALLLKGPATWGDRAKPPKKWFRVPEGEGVALSRKVLVWRPVPATQDHVKPHKDPEDPTKVLAHGDLTVFELRAGSAQDVLPPSRHPSGVDYIWADGAPKAREDLPELPPELLALWQDWGRASATMAKANPWQGQGSPGAWDVVRTDLQRLADCRVFGAPARSSMKTVDKILKRAQSAQKPARKPAPQPAPADVTPARAAKILSEFDATEVQPDWTPAQWCAMWCEHVTPQTMLERNGYKAAGKGSQPEEVARYLSPTSTTGEAGVVVLAGKDGRLRVFSHHGDAIAQIIARHPHADALDAWELLVELEHGGDRHHAILSARAELARMGVQVPAVRERAKRTPATPAPAQQTEGAQATPPALQGVTDEGVRNLSEDGLALIMGDVWAQQDGVSRVRYTPALEQWRVWQDYRWVLDDAGLVERSTLGKLRQIGREVIEQAKLVAERDPSVTERERKKLIDQASAQEHRLRTQRLRRAVISTAGVQARQATTVREWDADPWALCTPNGLVDLRSGKISPPHPRHMMTQATRVGPAPAGARPELYLATLHYLMGGERNPEEAAELVGYLRRVVGYFLTGSVREQIAVFGFGEGRNGKSLIVQTILDMLGDYATTIPTSMLMAQQNEGHPTEIARLMGKRLAVGSETEAGKQFAEARLKQLTGREQLVGRLMRQDFFTFDPQFKLLVVGNHKPDLAHVGVAMRRRLHLIPFNVTVPEERVDPDLFDTLRAEAPAILRWAIDGCLEWQRVGLQPPEAVLRAVDDYMTEQDAVGAWLQDCAVLEPGAWTPSAQVWDRWRFWCVSAGEDVGKRRALTDKLASKGLPADKGTGGMRVVRGLRLK